MNINELSFDIFYIPHSKLWSIKVSHKGIRLAAPYLIECATNIDEALSKLALWVSNISKSQGIGEQINNYVAHNKTGE